MRRIFPALLLAALFACAPARAAESRFVTDDLTTALRSGPGHEYRILTFLQAGTVVETLAVDGDWTQIRAPGDKQGWLESRVVTAAVPAERQLRQTRAERDALAKEKEALAGQLAALEKEKASAAAQGSEAAKARDALDKELTAWKQAQAGVMAIKAERDELSERAARMGAELDELRMENRRLSARRNVYWALSGALVVLIGYILGYVYVSTKNKRSSGYRF